MDLLKNPFHILTATTRDSRHRIMELADDRSLLYDSSECMEARSDLSNPRKRLSAELAWLPGIGPKRVGEVIALIESSVPDLLNIDKLTPIARANLLSAGLLRLPDYSSDDVTKWIIEISWAFEEVDAEELNKIINEERVVSGFPEVTDPSVVEAEVQERRRYYRQIIKSALDKLTAGDLVKAVTNAVESATDNGEEQGPILIDDIVDSYEVEAQEFLEKEEENINILVEKVRTDATAGKQDSKLLPSVNQLIKVVKNWDTVAQPIQVSTKSRGLNHDDSQRVAVSVRGLAIELFNEYDKLDLSKQLTSMLQEVFAEVVDVAELTSEDASTLDGIAGKRVRIKEEESIVNLLEKIRTTVGSEHPSSLLAPMINELIQAVKDWDKIGRDNGMDRDDSIPVAGLIRELAIQIFNEHNKLDFSQKLINTLQEVFADIDEIYERVTEDAIALNEISESRRALYDQFSMFNLNGESFSYKANRYNTNKISHIGLYRAITNHKVNFVSTGETEEIRIYLTMDNGKEIRLTVDEQGIFFKKDKSTQIEIFAEFHLYLSQITFDRRVAFYESQINSNGHFVYDNCYFYPKNKIVFKGKDFNLKSTSFLKGYGYVEMRKKDYGLFDKIKREVSLTKTPQFSTIVDTDVIFYLLKEYFSLSWKS